MDLISLITAKPVLIGLHLGFAIVAIDLFLWLIGEIRNEGANASRNLQLAIYGLLGLAASWIVGGYYYVHYYGPLVKPVINAGKAAWAHGIAMEAKEHIFLFLVPMALTVITAVRIDAKDLRMSHIKQPIIILSASIAGIGLFIGLLGFIISAAARWGAI